MFERVDKDFLDDICEAIDRAMSYVTGITEEEFLSDFKTQDAVLRNLEIIGEATKNLSEELRDNYPEIPWKSMSGVRDKLIHHYFGVNFDIVWHIVTMELPEMASKIAEIVDVDDEPESGE